MSSKTLNLAAFGSDPAQKTNCIALYPALNSSISFPEWYDFNMAFFQNLGMMPTHGGISRHGRRESVKALTFNSIERQLKKHGYSDVYSLELCAMPDEFNSMSDWILHSYADADWGRLFLGFDNSVLEYDNFFIENCINSAIKMADVQYGYVYQRPFALGPAIYDSGCLCGKEDSIESAHISNWGLYLTSKNGLHLQGALRDIYPMNILASAHLQKKLNNAQTVLDYINTGKGRLLKLKNDLWLWEIERSDIPAIREEFIKAGLLVHYMTRDEIVAELIKSESEQNGAK